LELEAGLALEFVDEAKLQPPGQQSAQPLPPHEMQELHGEQHVAGT
jgi:hypothetical protein